MNTAAQYKISFCIICMNRTSYLKETLLNNIIDNAGYDNLEIVLLDYNSRDDMEEWAKNNLSGYIAQRKVVYYKTFQPIVFSHSHSKNLAFKLAGGDIVCNINADSFAGPGFADYINYTFQKYSSVFMAPDMRMGFDPGTAGTVCVKKSDFFNVGGFDETMLIYGWEDVDFNNRLHMAGIKKMPIVYTEFLKSFDHVEKYDNKIHAVYVSHPNPVDIPEARVFILFNNSTYKTGTIINNIIKAQDDSDYARIFEAKKYRFQFELEEVYWTEGAWREEAQQIILSDSTQKHTQILQKLANHNGIVLDDQQELYYHITDLFVLSKISYFEVNYNNRLIMINNRENMKIVVNEGKFGQSTVYKNFNYETAIPVR